MNKKSSKAFMDNPLIIRDFLNQITKGPIIVVHKGVYKTGHKLREFGMCACSTCGEIVPIDYKYCNNCDEIVFIVMNET